MNPLDIFDEVTYRTYRDSRNGSPRITPASWKHVFGPSVDQMEERYQQEKVAAYASAGIKKDQRERIEGSPDDSGSDIFGRPMRFGS